jgi:protein-disulfide isomerase/uncharacterized membrane protein
MANRSRLWSLLFILTGLTASAVSLYVHQHLLRDSAHTAFCRFGEFFDCEAIYRSRFATFRGVPVALGEIIWFTLALLLMLFPGRRAANDRAEASYPLAISIPAVSVVLFYAYASLVVLGAVNVLNLVSYVAIVGVFVVASVSPTAPLAHVPHRLAQDLRALAATPLMLSAAIVWLAGSASAVVFFSRTPGNPTAALISALAQQPSDFDLWFESQRRVTVGLPPAGAAVLVVKFTDYQCAACAAMFKSEASVLAKYREPAGTVRLLVKDFPQDAECNPNVQAGGHEAACEAAAAVRLAREHGRGPQMEAWLYANVSRLTPESVRQAAREIGSIADFDEQYARVLADVRTDIELGQRLHVKTTPTVFVNGVKMEGELTPEFIDQAIAHELRTSASRH